MFFSCELYKRLSLFCSEKLYLYVQDKIDYEELKINYGILCAIVQTLNPDEPCVECEGCLDFRFYGKCLLKAVNEHTDKEVINQDLYSYENAIAADNMLNNLGSAPSEKDFNYTFYDSNLPKIYLDFNVIDDIEKDFSDGKFCVKEGLNIFYSPIHLEEVYRMNKDEYRRIRTTAIGKLTNNHTILNIDDKLTFLTEDPKYSYRRVLRNIGLSKAVEKSRTVEIKKRDIFYKENIGLAKTINNCKDVFAVIPEEEIDFEVENLSSESDIRNAIYNLFRILDAYSYYRDDKEKTVRSSIYDIEHLIYASCCDYFVTQDKRLRKRAEQIYKRMKINVKVIDYDEFRKMNLICKEED